MMVNGFFVACVSKRQIEEISLQEFSMCQIELQSKRLGITVFQPRLKVRTFARTNYYEYGKQRQVQESA